MIAVGLADCEDPCSDAASVFQEPGQLRAPHWGGGYDGDGPQARPHVCLHLRPVAVQPPASLWVKPLRPGAPRSNPRRRLRGPLCSLSQDGPEKSCMLAWALFVLWCVTALPSCPAVLLIKAPLSCAPTALITARGLKERKNYQREREREIGAK